MKKLLLMCCVCFVFSGCASWNTLKSDYMYGDDYDRHSFRDAWQTLKTDYLHADEFDWNTL